MSGGPGRGGPVYSTGDGRMCPACSRPRGSCACRSADDEPLPQAITARLRLETKGRGGKQVTVVDGLPRNRPFLEALLGEARRSLGTGGALGDGLVELRGDCRERLRPLLEARGLRVKG